VRALTLLACRTNQLNLKRVDIQFSNWAEEDAMEELRTVQRNYGAAFANVLTVARQHGFDCPTVERLLHALTLDDQAVPDDADCLYAELQSAALAFRQVVDVVHRIGVPALA
jgi:hypothetical protein